MLSVLVTSVVPNSLLVEVGSTVPCQEGAVNICLDTFTSEPMPITVFPLEVPGSVIIPNLEDGAWYMLSASALTDSGALLTSSSVRGRPVDPSTEPNYHVDIRRESLITYPVGSTTAFRLIATALNPKNMPAEIFLYQREAARAVGEEEVDTFVTVCKPGDLEYFPVGDPLDIAPRFFRKDSIDLVIDSADLVEETWNAILSGVSKLCNDMEVIRYVEPEGMFTIYSSYHDPVCTEA